MKPISFSLALKYLVFSASWRILRIPPEKQEHRTYTLDDRLADHSCPLTEGRGALKALWSSAPPSGPYQPCTLNLLDCSSAAGADGLLEFWHPRLHVTQTRLCKFANMEFIHQMSDC